ncbi:MAG: helix-turn-helix domain-containing protein [Thermomicrobiales bacterium]
MSTTASDIEELSAEELADARRYSMVIAWSPEDHLYVVSFPEFPIAQTHGRTVAEAAEMGEEIIASLLAIHRADGRPDPTPPRTARRFVLDPPPELDAAGIRLLRDRLRLSQTLFAALLNVSDSTVQSWEQGVKLPDGASLRLLDIFGRHPELIEELLEVKPSPTPPA